MNKKVKRWLINQSLVLLFGIVLYIILVALPLIEKYGLKIGDKIIWFW